MFIDLASYYCNVSSNSTFKTDLGKKSLQRVESVVECTSTVRMRDMIAWSFLREVAMDKIPIFL